MKPLLIFLLFLVPIHQASSEILIRTVAQVKNHVITSREVEIHKQLMEAIGSEFQNFRTKDPVEQVIKEWLLFFEASTFYNSSVAEERKKEVLSKAQEKLKDSSWRALDVSTQELTAKIRRRLEADRLFIFKRKASVLPVSLSEIETEYTQNRVNYGNFEFEEVKEKIRKNKIEDNLQKRLEQWFQVLEKKYKVQRFSTFKKSNQE